jgi:hypothetical protein
MSCSALSCLISEVLKLELINYAEIEKTKPFNYKLSSIKKAPDYASAFFIRL